MQSQMKIPTLDEAEGFLAEAETMNPGPWAQHSRNVALAARLVAECHPRLDPQDAYILGLLHDIGRRAGAYHIRHLFDGYHFLQELGYEDAAWICLTHSFPIADINVYNGNRDCSADEVDFLVDFLAKIEFNAYDRLITICDGIAPPEGFCLLEKRMVDVALRYGINQHTLLGWRARFQIQAELEDTVGCSIYRLLPGVVHGTFGDGFMTDELHQFRT
jgi:hypothetical protein